MALPLNAGDPCPKCRTALRNIAAISRCSSLERTAPSDYVEGLTCWNCGWWHDAEVIPTKPMPGKSAYVNCYFPKGMTSDQRGKALHDMVIEQMAEIDSLYRLGLNWKSIVEDLHLPMSSCTLYKYWKLEKGLR